MSYIELERKGINWGNIFHKRDLNYISRFGSSFDSAQAQTKKKIFFRYMLMLFISSKHTLELSEGFVRYLDKMGERSLAVKTPVDGRLKYDQRPRSDPQRASNRPDTAFG
jgi:hypothetical protein